MLVGKYVPISLPNPFQVLCECAQIIYDQTSSPRLDKVLKKWEEEKWASAENRQQLANIILVEPCLSICFAHSLDRNAKSPLHFIQLTNTLLSSVVPLLLQAWPHVP